MERKKQSEEAADETIEVIKEFIDRRYRQGRRPALRDAHAKDNGCVHAMFRVDQGLRRNYG